MKENERTKKREKPNTINYIARNGKIDGQRTELTKLAATQCHLLTLTHALIE
jgi:hypothetical protein